MTTLEFQVHNRRQCSSGLQKTSTNWSSQKHAEQNFLVLHKHIYYFVFHLSMLQHLLFTDPDDLLNFRLIIAPDEGFYRNGRFSFNFKIGPSYPHEPPKVKCVTKIYHPNIDLGKNSFYRLTYHVMDLGWFDLNLGDRLLGHYCTCR